MSNLMSREQRGNAAATLFGRPFADLWNFDALRNLSTGVEISRTDNGYSVEVAVAGFKPDEIDVRLEDGLLSVSGKNEKRSFTRTFTLPDDVDEEHIGAKVEHGMLTLTLPLLPKAQPKKIQITVS
ncbi:MAG TPA: Hsp20/alpha crystallin family protein [Candidatus Baltobacteraceae bacterium]|jgi:HSP20 family protein|nr:Hsp20/alpha crystallin family protein [Candidatus Baltobacteraceae bacterium]